MISILIYLVFHLLCVMSSRLIFEAISVFVGTAEKVLVKAASMNVEGIELDRKHFPMDREEITPDKTGDNMGSKTERKCELKVDNTSDEGNNDVVQMQNALKRKK